MSQNKHKAKYIIVPNRLRKTKSGRTQVIREKNIQKKRERERERKKRFLFSLILLNIQTWVLKSPTKKIKNDVETDT
jgi:hypothetical protein